MSLHARDQTERDFDAFQDQLPKEYFTIGALLQTVSDYQFNRVVGQNRFSLGNARLQVKGVFDAGRERTTAVRCRYVH